MKRKLLSPLPLFRLFLCCLFVSSATGQTFDIQKALVGEWRGPRVAYQKGTYKLTVVFSQESGKLRAFIDPNINFGEVRRPLFYTATDLKLSENGLIFSFEVPNRTLFYEGRLSPSGEVLTMHFSYQLPSEPDSRITWEMKKVPLCNDHEALAAAIKNAWNDRGSAEALNILPDCLEVNLYEDKVLLLRGLLLMRSEDLSKPRYYNSIDRRYDIPLDFLDRSLRLNSQNPIAFYARAFIYSEKARFAIEKLDSLIESNNKEPLHRRVSDRQIETQRESAKRMAMACLGMSIGSYDSIIANDAFATRAYVKRAQTYYAAWSKYDPNPDYLDNALKDYKAAIELSPLSYELFYERALIYKYLNDTEKYEADMKRAEELKLNR